MKVFKKIGQKWICKSNFKQILTILNQFFCQNQTKNLKKIEKKENFEQKSIWLKIW